MTFNILGLELVVHMTQYTIPSPIQQLLMLGNQRSVHDSHTETTPGSNSVQCSLSKNNFFDIKVQKRCAIATVFKMLIPQHQIRHSPSTPNNQWVRIKDVVIKDQYLIHIQQKTPQSRKTMSLANEHFLLCWDLRLSGRGQWSVNWPFPEVQNTLGS